MTTLAVDNNRIKIVGDKNDLPVIASDIIYEGAAVGIVKSTGHVRPLTSVDLFAGFCDRKADNSSGGAAAINCRIVRKGTVRLSVSGAVITDIGQPVYATDDNTFIFLPTGAVYIGKVVRFVSSGVVDVAFDALTGVDPYEGKVKETVADDKTLDVEDTGKVFFVNTDAKTITLPATATGMSGVKIVNIGAFGTVAVTVDCNAADKIAGPDLAGADGVTLINTKATACRGDFIELHFTHANGPAISAIKGTWAVGA